MTYEKPQISFQKFHTDTFLDDAAMASGNGIPSQDDDIFEFISNFNGAIIIGSDGVGGWFNG